MYSKMRKTSSRSRITSLSFTMAGCFSFLKASTSRSLSASSQLKNLRFIFLTATWHTVWGFSSELWSQTCLCLWPRNICSGACGFCCW